MNQEKVLFWRHHRVDHGNGL